MTDRLRAAIPDITPFQHEQRSKMLIARDFSNVQMVQSNPPYHAQQLYTMVSEIVSAWAYAPMTDEVLKRVVDHCRNLVKAAHEAAWMFGEDTSA